MKRISLQLLKFSFVFFLASCSYLSEIDSRNENYILDYKSEKLTLAFSHNVNGETNPCGCRMFPLGGLAPLAGQLHDLKKDGEVIYVDTGDLFFPTTQLVPTIKTSLEYTARKLLEAKKQLGLRFMVPGDQDFSAGLPFFKEVASQISILSANLVDPTTFPHRKWAMVKNGAMRLYFIGVTNPILLRSEYAVLFGDIEEGIERALKEIKSNGYREGDPLQRLILLSHSGIDRDILIAKKFPQINWIIGAHDQRYTQRPEFQGKTQIVQVLSRNHYLGAITFDLGKKTNIDNYFAHEIREDRAKLISPNPMEGFISQYKSELESIQKREQSETLEELMADKNQDAIPLNDAQSCLTCHKEQVTHWEKTPHALAFATLIKSKAQHNPSCVGCHSLGHNNPKGFLSTKNVIRFEDQDNKSELSEKYWAEAMKILPINESVRKLSPDKLAQASQNWRKLDEKLKVTSQFANVQCLHCHQKDQDHPFESSKPAKKEIKSQCMACHTADQSPEWYEKGALNEKVFNSHLKKMSCPKAKF